MVGTKIDKDGNIIDGITVPAPTSYQYEWEDISKSTAGRTQDLEMHKNRIGRVIAISLSWENISIADCARLLHAFDPEYIYVKYLDAKEGALITCGFYTGTVSAPLFNTLSGKWESVGFKIATRKNAL